MVLKWVFPPNIQQQQVDVRELFEAIDTEIKNVFTELFAEEKLQDSDKVGLKIQFDTAGAHDFYVNTFMNDHPVQKLFTRVGRRLQSREELLFCTWRVTVDIFRNNTV